LQKLDGYTTDLFTDEALGFHEPSCPNSRGFSISS